MNYGQTKREITPQAGPSVYLTIILKSKILTAALPSDPPYLLYGIFLSILFPLPLHHFHKAVWQSSLFSFKRMNEDKKQSKMEHRRHRLLWFMMAGNLVLLCSLPVWLLARLPVCSFPSTLMESRSRLTVTPSSHQEWLIMVLNIDLCLTCVKNPPTL